MGIKTPKYSDKLNEKCGVIGVFSNQKDAARNVYYGLWSLQHRGQESSGIASSTSRRILIHKKQGLIANVYSEKDLKKLSGHIAIGHNRYSTSGGSIGSHVQPVYRDDHTLALAHNGNIPVTTNLKNQLKKAGIGTFGLNDSEIVHKLIRHKVIKGSSLKDAVLSTVEQIEGVYCFVIMNKNQLIAVRDKYGVRPLSLGKINGTYIVASETCVFGTVGAEYIRDINPGECLIIDKNGFTSVQFAEPNQKLDVFEYVYFARPDSVLLGKSVYEVRKLMGKQLFIENKNISGDIVVPVPDSSIPSAIGFSQASNIPYETALIKNRYIHRTFIKPAQKQRLSSVQMKLNALPQVLKGKDVIVIDDSIVRGTTSKRLISLLREAGAKKVSMLVSSPPVKYPDFYGIDTPKQKDLIAANMTISEIKEYIGADDLRYLSFDGMISSIGVSLNNLCTSCFTGDYPVSIGNNLRGIKKV